MALIRMTPGLFPWTTSSNTCVLANKPESKKEISEMGFPFWLPAPRHPPCAMRSSRYLLSPWSRAEQSLKVEHHICDLCVSLRGSKSSQVFYFCEFRISQNFAELLRKHWLNLILRLNRCFPSCFQAMISKNQKSPCKGLPTYAIILKALGWPGFFKCEFSTCTDSVICDILIKHVNWPSAEERWNEV